MKVGLKAHPGRRSRGGGRPAQ